MERKGILGIIFSVILSLCTTQAWSENTIDTNSDKNIIIAVTINGDDLIIGKLEYSNRAGRYPLQLVTFSPIGGVILPELYFFEIREMGIISKNVHRIKFRRVDDDGKYGVDTLFFGTINFHDKLKPKIKIVKEDGDTFISNITEKGKETHKKYIPNVWLGH